MKHSVATACILGFIILFAEGCVTGAPPTSPEVTLHLAPERVLARHGVAFTSDPFLAPATLLVPTDEFVTVAVDIALPEATKVSISGDVEGADGTSLARLYAKDELREYWLARGRAADRDMVKRLDYLDSFYPPTLDFVAHKGRSELYVVMIGKRPIPRPAKAMLTVSLGSGDPQQFEFDLPPFKK
jgi:hypothetical protein